MLPGAIAGFGKVIGLHGNEVSVGPGVVAKGKNELSFRLQKTQNQVGIGRAFEMNNLQIVFKGRGCKLIIGDDVRLTGRILIVGTGRTVRIGSRTTAQGLYILSREADVSIGEDCMFSREIEIRASDVHKIYDLDSGTRVNPACEVTIGNRVWVAARAFVSKGASIPDGSVVGAMSFVNRAFEEPNVVVAGCPARVIRRRVRWER